VEKVFPHAEHGLVVASGEPRTVRAEARKPLERRVGIVLREVLDIKNGEPIALEAGGDLRQERLVGIWEHIFLDEGIVAIAVRTAANRVHEPQAARCETPGDGPEVRAVPTPRHMLQHSNADDSVVFASDTTEIAEVDPNAIREPSFVNSPTSPLGVCEAEGYARTLDAVVLRSEDQQAAKPAADVQQAMIAPELQLAADTIELRLLQALEIVVRDCAYPHE
jgi:hypothetical protein